jgi:hypothetical protein
MQKNESKPELADIFRKYGADYRRSHFLSIEQSKTMYHIEICRTSVLGGHTEACDHCGFKRMLTTHAETGTVRNARHL